MKMNAKFIILPPIELGQEVYFILNNDIFKAKVNYIRWEQHKDYGVNSEIRGICGNGSVSAKFTDYGKTVFSNRQDAEKVLYGGKINE